MEYIKAILPWLPLIIATVYSGAMSVLAPNDKLYMLFGLVCIFLVWICTKKWGGDSTSTLSLVEANKKLLTENEGLKENLVKVYNMVQAQSRGVASKPPPPPQPPIMPPVPSSQNQSPMPEAGISDDTDGKPYL